MILNEWLVNKYFAMIFFYYFKNKTGIYVLAGRGALLETVEKQ